MIRVAILDPHPAVRAGLEAVLRELPDVVPVGTAAGRRELWPLLYRTDPEALVLGDLQLCLRVAARMPGIRLVAYMEGADPIAAVLAGAHAAVDPQAGFGELLRALRSPSPLLEPITPRMRRRAAAPLEPVDRAILAMTLAGTPADEIAETVGLDARALSGRRAAILSGAVGPLDGPRELHA